MTGSSTSECKALDRLANALADDILHTSDEEILAEFRDTHGDPERHAAEMRALFEKSVLVCNKRRLAAAKVAVASRRPDRASSTPIDIAEARKRLRAILNQPNVTQALTMAARKEQELSDADIVGMIDDLSELGLQLIDCKNGERH